jgi:hypothetical protein
LNKATSTLRRSTLEIARNIIANTKATAEYASVPAKTKEKYYHQK